MKKKAVPMIGTASSWEETPPGGAAASWRKSHAAPQQYGLLQLRSQRLYWVKMPHFAHNDNFLRRSKTGWSAG